MMASDVDRDAEVAIIGMAGRFPGATTLDRFWLNLRDGVNSISFFSVNDLEEAGVPEATLNDPTYVRASPILEDVEKFDATFFGYSPREASFIDPQQRILLECAWEALEHAGYSEADYPYPVGIYAGSSLNTYFLFSGLHTLLAKDFVLALSSSDKDFVATRIAHKLNLQGPAITVQTACSTSLTAVHVACQSLFNGECDMALAGGVSVKVPQRAGYFWQPGGIVSQDGHVRTFDAKAAGTVFGSAAGIVVLKRLRDAMRDRDFIHAVIKGSALNNDGSAKATFTAPSVDKQSDVVVEAIARAGVSAETISYIEAHGTGTPLGDPIEITALTKAFRVSTQRNGFCAIGSVKPNIGHAEAASGIVGLIKTVLALKNKLIPPAVDFDEPNPNIDFRHSPFFVNRDILAWPEGTQPRRAGINSLGVGGTNVHVVLEEAPVSEASRSGRTLHLVPMSARTSTALQAVRMNLRGYFERCVRDDVADAAFTLQVGRRHLEYRSFDVRSIGTEVMPCLKSSVVRHVPRGDHRPVFIFPGDLRPVDPSVAELYERELLFRQPWDNCTTILRRMTGAPPEAKSFALEYAMAQLWMAWGVRPSAVVGERLGQFVAACVAGSLSLEDALHRICHHQWLTDKGSASPESDLTPGPEGIGEPYPETVSRLLSQGARIFLELGSGWLISKMLLQTQEEGLDDLIVLPSLPPGDAGGPLIEHLLTKLGELWTAGVDIDWNSMHEGERRRRIPVPTYPFQRIRHWLAVAAQVER